MRKIAVVFAIFHKIFAEWLESEMSERESTSDAIALLRFERITALTLQRVHDYMVI